jgi:hypothetical protein
MLRYATRGNSGADTRVYPAHVYAIGAHNTRMEHDIHGMYHSSGILQKLIMC